MQAPPIAQAEIDARIGGHVDELLQLWWAEQGLLKPRDLELIASVIPFARDEDLRVLDLCCGPGDAGRAVRRVYPKARIDCIDRDPFLTSICKTVNARDGIPGTLVVRDLEDDGWQNGLADDYHVVVTVNALHWFDLARGQQLIKEAYGMLRRGGVFLLAEPVTPERPFADGFDAWKERQPPRYSRENWERFWSRANALLGYDHIALLGPRDDDGIGDSLSVADWVKLLSAAGFRDVDVVWRDADQVIIGAVKPLP